MPEASFSTEVTDDNPEVVKKGCVLIGASLTTGIPARSLLNIDSLHSI
jgi:hypothetical protein